MFIIGVIIGYIFAKALKKLIIISIVIFILSYIGVVSLNLGRIQEFSQEIKEVIFSTLASLIPSTVFLLGVIVGFLLGLM
jgi:uncharacterized membrane protein (Fun14 family)